MVGIVEWKVEAYWIQRVRVWRARIWRVSLHQFRLARVARVTTSVLVGMYGACLFHVGTCGVSDDISF